MATKIKSKKSSVGKKVRSKNPTWEEAIKYLSSFDASDVRFTLKEPDYYKFKAYFSKVILDLHGFNKKLSNKELIGIFINIHTVLTVLGSELDSAESKLDYLNEPYLHF